MWQDFRALEDQKLAVEQILWVKSERSVLYINNILYITFVLHSASSAHYAWFGALRNARTLGHTKHATARRHKSGQADRLTDWLSEWLTDWVTTDWLSDWQTLAVSLLYSAVPELRYLQFLSAEHTQGTHFPGVVNVWVWVDRFRCVQVLRLDPTTTTTTDGHWHCTKNETLQRWCACEKTTR